MSYQLKGFYLPPSVLCKPWNLVETKFGARSGVVGGMEV